MSMDRDGRESASRGDLLPADVLDAIEREQQRWLIAVDSVWRLSCVLLICLTVIAPSIRWLQAVVLILAMSVGTAIVERDISARKKRINEVRRARMLLEEGDPNKSVHRYIEFINSSSMIPFVARYQGLAYWLWTAITAIVVLSKVALS